MDNEIRDLARLAGGGDLDAAKRLVRYLERAGYQSKEEALLRQAIETLAQSRKSSYSGVHDDLLRLDEMAFHLAKNVVTHLGSDPEIKENAFGVTTIRFANGSGVDLDNDGIITVTNP